MNILKFTFQNVSYLLKKVDRSLFYFKQVSLIIRARAVIASIIGETHI